MGKERGGNAPWLDIGVVTGGSERHRAVAFRISAADPDPDPVESGLFWSLLFYFSSCKITSKLKFCQKKIVILNF